MNKKLYLPIAYHGACYVGFLISAFIEQLNKMMNHFLLFDFVGVIIAPLFIAIITVIDVYKFGGQMFDNYKKALLIIIIIGVIRTVVLCGTGAARLMFCLICLLCSLLILTIWYAVFAITKKLMKR